MFHKAFDLPLKEGLRFERRLFHGLFATSDQKEGENACFRPIRAFSLDSVLQGWPHLLRSGNQNLRTSKVSLLSSLLNENDIYALFRPGISP